MHLRDQVSRLSARIRLSTGWAPVPGDPAMIARGWDEYAKNWNSERFRVIAGHAPRHLGDEWTAEDDTSGGTTYGLPQATIDAFDTYISERLLKPHLPPQADRGLEIGPGGGRLTALLLPETRVLHVADTSETMLRHLRERFKNSSALRAHHIDGLMLPRLGEASLDYVVAFDVFVHFEPRLVYWYLRQIVALLNVGGVGIIHYANALTRIGWQQFMQDLETNVQGRRHFAAFGVMCPTLMERFLTSLGVEIVAVDLGVIPRDAVTVFRRL